MRQHALADRGRTRKVAVSLRQSRNVRGAFRRAPDVWGMLMLNVSKGLPRKHHIDIVIVIEESR